MFRKDLEQISTIRDHLMESNQHTQRGEQRAAIPVSEKLLNEADGLIWPTGGWFSATSGHSLPSGLNRGLCFPCGRKDQGGKHASPADAENQSSDSVWSKLALGKPALLTIQTGILPQTAVVQRY